MSSSNFIEKPLPQQHVQHSLQVLNNENIYGNRLGFKSSKHLLSMLGLLLMKHSRWARAMYVDGSSRGQSVGTITRRIRRCFLRIVASMHGYGSCYDEDRYIRSLLKNGVPWAKSLKVAG